MTGEAAIRINENSVIRESIYGKGSLGTSCRGDPSVYGSGGGRYYRADDQTVWGYL